MDWLFQQDGFVCRGACGGWNSALLTTDRLTNLSIAISYIIIALTLYVVYKRSERPIIFRFLYPSFACFIWACGMTHIMEWMATYVPVWRVVVLMEILTSVASWATIISMAVAAPHLSKIRINFYPLKDRV